MPPTPPRLHCPPSCSWVVPSPSLDPHGSSPKLAGAFPNTAFPGLAPSSVPRTAEQTASPRVTAALGWLGPSTGQLGFGPDPVPTSEDPDYPPREWRWDSGDPHEGWQQVVVGWSFPMAGAGAEAGLCPGTWAGAGGLPLGHVLSCCRGAVPWGAVLVLCLGTGDLAVPAAWGASPRPAGTLEAGAGPAQCSHCSGVSPSPLNGEAGGMHIPEAGAWLATPSPQTSGTTSPALPHQEGGAGVEGQFRWVPRTCH